MGNINYTWPGRFHLIWKPGLFYITLWLPLPFVTRWWWRLHYCLTTKGDGHD